jgi:hypothetical protein
MDKSQRNYFRITVKALSAQNRPVILIGQFAGIQKNSGRKDMIIMTDIKPYLPNHGTDIICDHICFFDFPPELKFANRKEYYCMVCRPYLYKDEDMNIRGSFKFSNELGECLLRTNSKTTHSKEIRAILLNAINTGKCVDFLKFAEGRYAWKPGMRSWKDGHKLPIEAKTKEQKMKEKQKRRAARKKNISVEELEKKKEKPLTILEQAKLKYGW